MLFETLIIVSFIVLYLFISNLVMNKLCGVLKIDNSYGNNFLSIFFNSLLFSLALVCVFAIVLAKGKTVFIFLIPLFYFLYKSKKSEAQPLVQNNNTLGVLKTWGVVTIVSLITIICSYYFTLKFSIRNDTAHYVKIGEYLAAFGIENPYHYYNAENPIFKGLSPYHYFEMWFGGFFFRLNESTGITIFSNYFFYIYVVFNLFRVMAIVGIFGLASNYVKFNYFFYLVSLPILLIDISAFANWGVEAYVAESNFFERPNFIFYYLFLIPVIYFLLTKDRHQQVLWSAFFVVASITAVPAIGGALLLKLAHDWYLQKEERRRIIFLMIAFMVFVVSILVFYQLFGVGKEASTIENMTLKEMIAKTLSLWKACVFMFVMLSAKIGLFILLIFALILPRFSKGAIFDKSFNKVLIYISLLCFTGIALFQLVPYIDNMYQFAFIGYCSVVLVLIVVLIIKVSQLQNVKKIIFMTITLALVFIGFKRNLFYDHILLSSINWNVTLQTNFLLQNGLSYSYIKALESEAPVIDGKNGASLIDDKDVMTDFLGLRHSVTYQLGNYIMVYNNKIHLPLLSDRTNLYPDTNRLSKDYYKAKKFNEKALFYRTYDDSLSYRENLMEYLEEQNINYIFASKGVDHTKYLDSSSVLKVIKDLNKGHQLIILNNVRKNNL